MQFFEILERGQNFMEDKKIIIFYLSQNGEKIAQSLLPLFKHTEIFKLNEFLISQNWNKNTIFIFIMAIGIVIRKIAKYIKNKKEDPGVIVINEKGEFVIPVLGGHSSQTNKLAQKIADFLFAKAVITTASNSKGLPALDLWIKRTGLIIKNPEIFPKIMAKFNKQAFLNVYKEKSVKFLLFNQAKEVNRPELADIIITNKKIGKPDTQLILIIKNLWIGIGFHEGLKEKDFKNTIFEVLDSANFEKLAIKGIATLDKKAHYLPLKNFCKNQGFILMGLSKKELEKVKAESFSKSAYQKIGVESVCEQSALYASKGKLVVKKKVFKDLTIAIAEENYSIPGKLYIIGTGPGNIEYLTLKALNALRESEVIVGYKTYLKFLEGLFLGKEVISSSMTQEVKRAKQAIESALRGKITALISGGDPGIYGMAGLVLELLAYNKLSLEIEIIPGVSALNACSSLVGAPLINDFAVISLSDRLTPWEIIENRLKFLAQADVPIVIFNPKSKKRTKHLSKAKEIILNYRPPDTPVAIIISAMRDSQKIIFSTLKDFDDKEINMQTTIIIGNSQSFFANNWLITPRGYQKKYEDEFKISYSLE